MSDRGGASGMIGDRWSDLTSAALDEWPGTTISTPDGEDVTISRVVRLDDIPAVARMASKRKLQNPDFVIVGKSDTREVVFSADAKFSVETASSSQVSAEALQSLLDLGEIFTTHLGDVDHRAEPVDGMFLSPEYSLTHYMMRRKKGYRSVSVPHSQIHLLPVRPVPFLKPLEGARLIPILADVDGYDPETRSSLLVALYYFRLVRAAVGCWSDMVAPLLGPKTVDKIDLPAIEERTRRYAIDADSAWAVVDQWDAAAETVRAQRETVNRVTSVPIVNRELREELDAAVEVAGVEAPSMNRVRRRIGSWFREEIVARVGLLEPPVDNFPAVIHELEMISGELRNRLPEATTRIIHEMLQEPTETMVVTPSET
ncbi:MAG TPA: hypothetical protein VKZ61_05420 [Thermomicrobiales bacterium]|nr:hypothetical protein [Thermomicrobiales bacterium]